MTKTQTDRHRDDRLDADPAGRDELRRAYLQLGFGQFDRAIESCERAAELAPDHYLPITLKGSVELAAGRLRQALATLRRATRRHADQPLGQVYFAEACLLGGRRRQGRRALKRAKRLDGDGACSALIDQVEQLWESVAADETPPPLVVEPAEPSP